MSNYFKNLFNALTGKIPASVIVPPKGELKQVGSGNAYATQKFLDSIVENIPNMVFVKEAQDLRFALFNKAGEDLLGFKKENMLGKNDYDFFPKKEADWFTEKDRLVLRSGMLHDISEEVIHTGHGERTLHTKKIPILDDKGEPLYLLGISEDITERKQLEHKLAEYTKNLEEKVKERTEKLHEEVVKDEALIESIGEGLIATDVNNNIIVMNTKAEKLLGFEHGEAIGTNVVTSIKVEDVKGNVVPQEDRPISTALRTKTQITSREFFCVRKDKSRFPVLATASPVLLEENIIGGILVFRDITKEKEIETAKDEFISLISHELRTPLTIANWYTKESMKSGVELDPVKQKEYLVQTRKAVERMNDLVSAILEISKIEVGRFDSIPILINIPQLADGIVEEFGGDMFAKKVHLNKTYGPDVQEVYIDKKIVTIVLQNLVSNAVRYNKQDGEINLFINKVENNLEIKISDNGCGISENESSSIFTKLFRADNAKEKEPNGTGLGLYICKKFLEQIGGSIIFESKKDKGTTFYVKIPLASKAIEEKK